MTILQFPGADGAPAPANGEASPHVRDITTQEFQTAVLMESMKRPVIVDFWATWCGPCKQLGPALEKAVNAVRGAVAMVKVDIDRNPDLAQMLHIQSVPTVYAFFQGQPVHGFMGAQPDSQIAAFIADVMKMSGVPMPDGDADDEDVSIETLLAEAQALLDEGDHESALAALSDVAASAPADANVQAAYLAALLQTGDIASAQTLFSALPETLQEDSRLSPIKARFAIARSAPENGDAAALEATLSSAPDDHAARFDLANMQFNGGNAEAAIDNLLYIIKTDRTWRDDAARTQLLSYFDSLGFDNEHAMNGRKKLSGILFS